MPLRPFGSVVIGLCVAVALGSCQPQQPRIAATGDVITGNAENSAAKTTEPQASLGLVSDSSRKEPSIVNMSKLEPQYDNSQHDASNDAFLVLQDPAEALKNFPLDRRQQVNWVQALDQGLIEPRPSLTGAGEMLVMDMDILFTNTQDMPYVHFPHLQHTRWLDCSNCHPKIFIPRRGANPVSMNKVLRGEFCGVCHDKVAFSLFICERCHSVPHAGSGKWW